MIENLSLLIIDDDESVRKSIGMWLKSEGFSIFTAANSQKAIEIIKKLEIALCLVDLKLHNEDGLQVTKKLKELDELMKIIIITAYPEYKTAIEAMRSGIYDYISKSEDHQSILKKINSALEDRENTLRIKKSDASEKNNIILICDHLLIKEGIENFCKENPNFHLLHNYSSFSLIKNYDFNCNTSLLLICASCHPYDFGENQKEMLHNLHLFFPKAKIIAINSNFTDDEKKNLLLNKVKGFFPPHISKEQIKEAFNSVLKGEVWVDTKISNKLLSELLDNIGHPDYKKSKKEFNLSVREIEILQAMASGLPNLEISKKLFLSEKTVKTHIHNIFKKMNVKTRIQAVMKAIKHCVI